jgi:DNA-directed RNA polymerase specialized sigma24 family protein
MKLTVDILRECFRHIEDWRATYETDGIDVIVGPGGMEICLWDLEYLLTQLDKLPPRQSQAIQLFLVENHKEKVAAKMMGVSEENPIGMYATSGLAKLVAWVNDGSLPRYSETLVGAA